MPSYKAQLLEIKPDEPDAVVATLAAGAAMEIDRQPYCFSINHNVGAPKFARCPVRYDFRWGKTVGIKTMQATEALAWITEALLLGYTVTRAGSNTQGIKDNEPYGDAWELKRIRERAKWHQTPRTESDDDIPF